MSSNNNQNGWNARQNNRKRFTSTSSFVEAPVEIPPSHITICKQNDNFVKQLNAYRQEGKLCDFTIKVSGRTFLVHKVVLSLASKYFEAMFSNCVIENEKMLVTFEDVEPESLESILDYIYLNPIHIADDNIQDIANLSSRFQLMDLAESCADFMHRRLRVDNCIGVMRFADLLAFVNLRLAAKRFAESNYAEIVKEDEFLELPSYMLKSFLKSEDLSIDSEDQVLESTLKWIVVDKDGQDRMKLLDEFLGLIRMPLINENVINKTITQYEQHPQIVESLQRFVLKQKLECCGHDDHEGLTGYEIVRNQARMAARRSIFMIGGATFRRQSSRHPSQISNVVEKFDLHSYEWTSVAAIKIPRYSHSAVVLDRKIFVIGGNADSLILDSVEVYDPKRDEWQLGAQLRQPRTNLGACVFDGRIYVFGGLSCRAYRSIEVYDPMQSNQWFYYDDLPMRMFSMRVVEHKRYIYIIGGCDENSTVLNTIWRYNPMKKLFTAMAPMNQARCLFGCVAIHNLIYVFGGNDGERNLASAEQYNIKEVSLCPSRSQFLMFANKNSWSYIPKMPNDVIAPCAIACNNMVYVFGGRFEIGDNRWQGNKIVSVYEPGQNQWNFGKQLNNPRSDAASVLI